MKILVLDDDAFHREGAKCQLGEANELTVVATYDEVADLLRCGRDANSDLMPLPDFDIVLLDLLVPASSRNLSRDKKYLAGQEMPLGTTLAFLAIKAGIKRIAVVTDAGHHDHPASAALDDLRVVNASTGLYGDPIVVGDVRILFSNYNNKAIAHPATAVMLTPEEEDALTYADRQDYLYVKNWKKIVEQLTAVSP